MNFEDSNIALRELIKARRKAKLPYLPKERVIVSS